ncbi:MAG: hypothetical protein ABIA93_00110 [Candidatus Woesearchaeota archaeon]
MNEMLHNAKEELKRADHLVFVSLKYTRTVDVVINALNRLIEAYDFLCMALLEKAKEKNLIMEIPETPVERAHAVKEMYPDDKVLDNIELYLLIRKIVKSNVQKENEYRRHVALITYIAGRQEIVNIDIITEYFAYVQEFAEHVEKLLGEE